MQIREVVLYSHDQRMRRISFQLGQLNIITGESEAGKSALIPIVRYVLGSDDARIPEGVITERVAWFGLLLDTLAGPVFVARPIPEPGRLATNLAMISLGANEPVPPLDLTPNTNTAAVATRLSRAIGIPENASVPSLQTGEPVDAALSHALFFCLQRQSEIANPDALFHRQSEEFISTAIRDSLSFFLGSVDPQYILKRDRLRRLRREINRLQRRLDTLSAFQDSADTEAQNLLVMAHEAGLLPQLPDRTLATDEAFQLLNSVRNATDRPDEYETRSGRALNSLQQERADLLERHRGLADRSTYLRRVRDEQQRYSDELESQEDRLAPIGLLSDESTDQCPVCGNELHDQIPSVRDLTDELVSLRSDLSSVGRDTVRLDREITALDAQLAASRARVRDNRSRIDYLLRERQELQTFSDRLNLQSYVRGRISQFLDVARGADDSERAEIESVILGLGRDADRLEQALSLDTVREHVLSTLNVIGGRMTAWAQRLGLGYADGFVRIDQAALTVVADTENGPVPLSRMGSGKNWVGYHLVSHLGLHEHFVNEDRPVPRFLILDQPSQAFFPPDVIRRDGLADYQDADHASVRLIFELLHEVPASLDNQLQLIVLDHLNLRDEWFQDAVSEEWRDGRKLVPNDWPARERPDSDYPSGRHS